VHGAGGSGRRSLGLDLEIFTMEGRRDPRGFPRGPYPPGQGQAVSGLQGAFFGLAGCTAAFPAVKIPLLNGFSR